MRARVCPSTSVCHSSYVRWIVKMSGDNVRWCFQHHCLDPEACQKCRFGAVAIVYAHAVPRTAKAHASGLQLHDATFASLKDSPTVEACDSRWTIQALLWPLQLFTHTQGHVQYTRQRPTRHLENYRFRGPLVEPENKFPCVGTSCPRARPVA